MHPALEKLASIEQAATKGPWTCDGEDYAIYVFGGDGNMVCEMRGHGSESAGYRPDGEHRKSQELIAAARNALPALIAMVVEIEEALSVQSCGCSFRVREIIHKHLEPLK